MAHPCIDCFNKKKKLFFDIEKARQEAKAKAIEEKKTYGVWQDGSKAFYQEAEAAREAGIDTEFPSFELVSFHL